MEIKAKNEDITMKLKKSEVLVLRTCKDDMTSYNGFKWPREGYVEAPDWQDDYKCGHGLHGLLWGEGDISYLNLLAKNWLIVKVDTTKGFCHGKDDMINKCKFRCGYVVYCGDRYGAIKLIQKYAPANSIINFAVQTAGDCSTQTAGNESTQTAGDWSTQTAGDCSTQTAGYRSTQTAGYRSAQTAGDCSTQTAGDKSMQRGGLQTVQIIRYFKNEWRVKTRIITEKEADKWYIFENEDWRLLTDEEIRENIKR